MDVGKVFCLLFIVCGSAARIWDLGFVIIDLFGVWGLMFVAWGLNEYVRRPGKTRGAIGFALIFLCFVSLYQDKEMKK